MSKLPDTWTEVTERLVVQFGGGEHGEAVAAEWIRQALACKFGVQDPSELPRVRRAYALQRMLGVLFALEDDPRDFAFILDTRGAVAAVFARFFDGCVLDGPPWRLDPADDGLPDYTAWADSASFD